MHPMSEDPWAVCEQDFPWNDVPAEKLKFLLNYAVLAPSCYNAQPWMFKITGAEAALYADRTRALSISDPDDRELIMGCGAALFNLRIAIRHYGFEPVVRTFPDLDDPDLLAYVRIGPPKEATLHEHRLFMAVKKRRTNRTPFEQRPVPPLVLAHLEAAARAEGACLHVIQEPDRRNRLARLIAEGDRLQTTNKHFRRELASWVHPNQNGRLDGLRGSTQGMGDLLSYAGPLLIRTFDWGRGQAAKNRQLAEGSPVLAVLSTPSDRAPHWLAAGQALCCVLLTASDYDLYASFLNQPVEVPALRQPVADLAGGGCPQLILRIGYGQAVQATPRRPVRDVLLTYGG